MLRKAFESLTEAKGASILLCSSNKAVAWLPVAEVVLVCRQIHMLRQGTILQQQLLQQRGGTVQGALDKGVKAADLDCVGAISHQCPILRPPEVEAAAIILSQLGPIAEKGLQMSTCRVAVVEQVTLHNCLNPLVDLWDWLANESAMLWVEKVVMHHCTECKLQVDQDRGCCIDRLGCAIRREAEVEEGA